MDTPADGAPKSAAKKKSGRGFASMSEAKRRDVAAKGGRAAQAKGTAHRFTTETAIDAGRKGGTVSRGGRGRLATPPNTSAA